VKTLVLSVDIGAGHRMAAEAVCASIAAQRPGSEHRIVEALEYMGPDGGKLAKEMYFGVLEDAPGLWGAVYGARGLHDLLRPLGVIADDLRASGLTPLVRAYAPDVVLAMHPIACGLAGAIGRRGAFPVAAVLTDFDAHPSWIAEGIDLYLTATDAMTLELERHGVRPGAAVATGIPLRPAFATVREGHADRARLGLDPTRFTILLLGGGLGLGPIGETAQLLARLEGPLQIVLIAGSNEELAASARAVARTARIPVHVRGRVDNVADFMSVSDLAIGKPGGLTCAELLAAGVPLVALAPIPGQEKANSDYLVRAGVAAAAASAEEAVRVVGGLLAAPAAREAMRNAALKLGRPTSARAAAHQLFALCDRRPVAPAAPAPPPRKNLLRGEAEVDEALKALKRKLGFDPDR
jgi:processive 1,2-diacylglycerol beta-glucosyltransferase